MKQMDMIRMICYPVRFQTFSRENALTTQEIAALLMQKGIKLKPTVIEKLLNYVVENNKNYFSEDGKYYYYPEEEVVNS